MQKYAFVTLDNIFTKVYNIRYAGVFRNVKAP